MNAMNVAITKDGAIVGYLQYENHTTDKKLAQRFYKANDAAQAMFRARSCHQAWNVDQRYGMMIVNA